MRACLWQQRTRNAHHHTLTGHTQRVLPVAYAAQELQQEVYGELLEQEKEEEELELEQLPPVIVGAVNRMQKCSRLTGTPRGRRVRFPGHHLSECLPNFGRRQYE
ncbi:hypothetical protein ACLKA6_013792 [Drosophila palustris]